MTNCSNCYQLKAIVRIITRRSQVQILSPQSTIIAKPHRLPPWRFFLHVWTDSAEIGCCASPHQLKALARECPMIRHEILGGNVQVYRPPNSRFWPCTTSWKGRQFQTTTHEGEPPQAKQFAEDWHLRLRGAAGPMSPSWRRERSSLKPMSSS